MKVQQVTIPPFGGLADSPPVLEKERRHHAIPGSTSKPPSFGRFRLTGVTISMSRRLVATTSAAGRRYPRTCLSMVVATQRGTKHGQNPVQQSMLLHQVHLTSVTGMAAA